MRISEILNKRKNFHESQAVYANTTPQPIRSNFFNKQFEQAKPVYVNDDYNLADVVITSRKPKKKPFDIGEYGETRDDMRDNIIKLKPTHNECRKVFKAYCNLIMEEDLFS